MSDSSEKPVRDEEEPSPDASSRRGSNRRSLSRSNHHRRSSGSSSPRPRMKKASSHSSLHSKSSNSKTRTARSGGSKSRPRHVSAAPGAHTVSSSARSASRKSSKFSRSSGQSNPGASRASDADRRADRKASRNSSRSSNPGASRASDSDQRTERKVSRNSSRSSGATRASDADRRAERKASRNSSRSSQNQRRLPEVESSPSDSPPTLEATAAPDIEEQLEEARRQAREEGRLEALRNERRDKEFEGKKNPVVVAITSDEESYSRATPKYKYMLVALVVVLAIGGGIAAWQLLSSRQTVAPSASVDLAPTTEDCLAMSEGSEVEGQDEMTPKTVEVELNLAMAFDVNPEQLKAELQDKLQQNVLPVLVGCGIEGPVSIENNIYLVKNALLVSVAIANSTSCSSDTEETCSSVKMDLELFLRDDSELDQSVLDLVTDLFQHESLLELLNLDSAIEEVDFIQVVEVFPSLPPSSSPSNEDFQSNVGARCQAIANGTPIEGQDTLSVQSYDVLLDVTLNSQADLSLLSIDLKRQLQAVIVPALAGCEVVRRRQSSSSSIETGFIVEAENVIDGSCLPGSETQCYRHAVYMDIFVDSLLSSADFAPMIREEFQKTSSLVSRLGLTSPFERIVFAGVAARTTSESPSANPTVMKSQSPTTRPTLTPSIGPTNMPVAGPTLPPTSFPSSPPTLLPTPLPTPLPTLPPTLPPTPGPTAPPTPPPTPGPTLPPTPAPTGPPTPRPTGLPTLQPSAFPTPLDSAPPSPQPSASPSPQPSSSPSLQPSSSPSMPCFATNTQLKNAVDDMYANNGGTADPVLKAAVEAQYGPIGDWCFGSNVNDMSSLFSMKTSFDEDISRWDVSGVTNMNDMFFAANVFNKDISSWNVAGVSDMRSMFNSAFAFNQDISSWDVSSVVFTRNMFLYAMAFRKDLCAWGQKLPAAGIDDFGDLGFEQSSCPVTNIAPSRDTDPPGPFCYMCS